MSPPISRSKLARAFPLVSQKHLNNFREPETSLCSRLTKQLWSSFPMSSGMTPLSFATCLIATCIALGASLECEECMALGRNCHGNKITCPPEKDSCGIISMDTMGQTAVMKTCVPSKICSLGLSSLSMGKAGVSRTNAMCCTGDDCKKAPPPLPPRNTTLNGKSCPACHALNAECQEEIVKCTGDENQCFSLSGITSAGTVSAKVTMKGCGNEAICYEAKQKSSSFSGISLVHDSSCTDGASTNIATLFGLLFPVLTGLLFGKLLV
nr:phospholipase A2 inhibitor and Ly6/PLAUR domain-containing protein-like [Anolis sagrei ordinatus]